MISFKKSALFTTSTLAIAFLPTYQSIGWWAPLILCILRFGQGFGLGGEWGGAALLAIENAPKGWEARFGSAPQAGVPIGFFFGAAVALGVAMAGATLARLVLDRLTNRAFLLWTRGLGVLVGAIYLVRGLYLLL